jgi:WD40 repeat protein
MKGWERGVRVCVLGLLGIVGPSLAEGFKVTPDEPKALILEPLQIRISHDSAVNSLAWSPDGKQLASGGDDKTIRLWDSKTGKQQAVLEGPTAGVWAVAYNPDGKTLASTSENGQVVLWDISTVKEKAELKGHLGRVKSAVFSPDGKLLATAGRDKSVRLWDGTKGQESAVLSAAGLYEVLAVAFSPNGKSLASVSWDGWFGSLRVWDVETRKIRAGVDDRTARMTSVAWSPDGKILAVGRSDKKVKLYDTQTWQEMPSLERPSDWTWSLVFSPDGKLLAAGGGPWEKSIGTVDLWDVQTGKQLATLKGHTDVVASVAFSPDGKTLASASRDKTVLLWEVPRDK